MPETTGATGVQSLRSWMMGVMMTVLLALAGITFQSAQETTKALQARIDAQNVEIQNNRQRTALLEQNIQYQQQQLDRIERGVEELRRRR